MNLHNFIREAGPHLRVIIAAGVAVRLLMIGMMAMATLGHVWPAVVAGGLALAVAIAAAVYIADRMPS